MRTTFTGRQIFEIERMFETKKYLNASERNNLSRSFVIVKIISWSALLYSSLVCVTEQEVKIWFQSRRTKYKKMESGASNEQPGEGVKKSDTENTYDKQDGIDSLINDQFNPKLDHTDLKLARYESSMPDNMMQVNKSSNHETDSLL